MKKNTFLVTLISLLFFLNSFSQENDYVLATPKYPSFFKSIPTISKNDPAWVLALYSKKPNIKEIESLYNEYYSKNNFVKSIHTQNYKMFRRAILNEVDIDKDGFITKKNIPLKKSFSANNFSAKGPASWSNIGPKQTYDSKTGKPVSKQANVYTISQSLTNANILLAGTEPGDIFLSTDKGENWQILTDNISLPYRSIGVVKIDPNTENIMYFTSHGNLYKSTDKGANWTNIKNFGSTLRAITIKTGSSNDVIAAGAFGIQRSTDGGTTWTSINTKNTWDAVRKTDDANTIFAVQLNTAKNLIEFTKSIDNGLTFNVFDNGWRTVQNSTGKMKKAEGAKIGVTNADGNVIYVLLLQSETNSFTEHDYMGIYKTIDAGATWTLPYDGNEDGTPNGPVTLPYTNTNWCLSTIGPIPGASDYSQGFYNAAIDVSDTDANTFVVGLINSFSSTDGGKTYKNIGGYSTCINCYKGAESRHADIQDIEINGNDIWIASDGGIDKYSTDFSTSTPKNKNLIAAEFFYLDQSWNEDVVAGGRYHNGNMVIKGSYSDNSGREVGGGEQATGYFDKVGSIVRFSDSDDLVIPEDLTGPLVRAPFNFSKYPNQADEYQYGGNIGVNPKNASEIILGKYNQIWKSTNKGLNFKLMATFNRSSGTISGNTLDTSFYGRFTNVAYASNNTKIIYILQYRKFPNHSVYKSIDGGVTWNSVTLQGASVHGLSPVQIQVAADNDDEVYLVSSNSQKTIVKRTLDGGTTWTDLPTFSGSGVQDMLVQDGTDGGVYLTTGGGVFYINNSMSTWQSYNTGLPASKQAAIIKPFYKEGKLRLGTRNRGVWESPLFEASKPIARPIVESSKYVCLKDTIRFDDYSILKHAGASWKWSFPGATYVSSTTVRNPKVLYGDLGNYNVTLTVTDATGASDTKTINNMVTIPESLCSVAFEASKALNNQNNPSKRFLKSVKDLNYRDTGNNLTISAWVKSDPNSNTTSRGIINIFSDFQFGTNVFKAKNGFYINGSSQKLVYYDGTGLSGTGLVLNKGEWNYVAAVWNGSTLTLYVNDKSETRRVDALNSLRKNYIVGASRSDGSDRFKGLIDEVKIYKRSLTKEEIYAGRHIITDITTDPALLAYYQFNSLSPDGSYSNLADLAHGLVPGGTQGTFSLAPSDAPIGKGVSQKLEVTAAGITDFNLADLKINFAAGTVPNGEVVVNRLDLPPTNKPSTSTEKIVNKYWIINNYGTNDTFTNINSLEFSNTPSNSLSSANISLFKRSTNKTAETDWAAATPANPSAIDTPNKKVTFTNPDITSSGQLYIGSDKALQYTWEGATDEKWLTPTNWSTGTVPEGTDDITISSAGNSPVISTDVKIKDITIDASATQTIAANGSLTVNGNLTSNGTFVINSNATSSGALLVKGTATGNITYNKHVAYSSVSAEGWHLVSAPIVGETENDIISNGHLLTNASNLLSFAPYNNSYTGKTGWSYLTAGASGTLTSGKGYSAKSTTSLIPFTGTLKTDDLNNYPISVGTKNSWNLVGNPYASFVSGNPAATNSTSNFLTENISQLDPSFAAIYVWNPTSLSYDIINNASSTYYIAPGQSFMLSSKTGGGSINIKESMLSILGSNSLSSKNSDTTPTINLKVANSGTAKTTSIKYLKPATTGLDIGYDAGLYNGDQSNFKIYSHLIDKSSIVEFGLQCLPENNYENMIVPIGLKTTAGNEIIFTSENLNLPTGVNVFLEDRETNIFTQLNTGNLNYKVTPAKDLDGVGRFFIHTSRSPLSVNDIALENLRIYKKDANTLRILGLNNNSTTKVELHNILGEKIYKTSFISRGTKDITLPELAYGIYVIRVITDKGILNQKIVLE